MNLSYVIGRFNPLHLGHHNLIDHLLENSDHHIVFIGSSNKSRTEKNPLTFEERKELIQIYYPDLNIIDMPDNDSFDLWKKEFHAKIKNYIKETSIEFSDISLFSPVREDDHSLRANWIPENHSVKTFIPDYNISATEIRTLWYSSMNFEHLVKKDTVEFLRKINK